MDKSLCVYKSEPITRFVTDKLKLSPIKFGTLSFLIFFAIAPIGTILSGTAFFPSYVDKVFFSLGFIPWWTTWPITILIINSLMIAYYKKISIIFTEWREQEIIVSSEKDYNSFIEKANSIYNNKIIQILIFLIVFFAQIGLYFNLTKQPFTTWMHHKIGHLNFLGWYFLFSYIEVYLILSLCYRGLVTSWILKKALQTLEFKPKLAHPDGRWGLGTIANLIIIFCFFLSVITVNEISMVIGSRYLYGSLLSIVKDVGIYLRWSLCLILAFGLFFVPLPSAIKQIKIAKQIILIKLSRILNLILDQMLSDDMSLINRPKFENFNELRKTIKSIEDMPSSPFDTKKMLEYILTVLIPIIFSAIVNFVSNFIKVK